jgi:hypothetical protein
MRFPHSIDARNALELIPSIVSNWQRNRAADSHTGQPLQRHDAGASEMGNGFFDSWRYRQGLIVALRHHEETYEQVGTT